MALAPLALALALAAEPPAAAPAPLEPTWTVPVAHTAGVMAGMRLGASLAWPEAYDPTRLAEQGRQLRLAYTAAPEFHRGAALLASDGDPAWLNGIGHGLFGAEVYGRARVCGHGAGAALLAVTVASTVWEYGLEAPYKRPSAVDLVWTPLAGAILGELRARLLWAVDPRRRAGWVRFVVDPLGETERRVLRTRC